jgi:hypothetical protein
MIETQLKWLNNENGADEVCAKYHQKVLDEFKDNLVGVVMGSAYGGEIEYMGKLWQGKGTVYGYDTFEDLHPKQLATIKDSLAAICMDCWYEKEGYEPKTLSVKYQREVLDKQGLKNVKLIKGLVNKNSCKDIDKIHYAFLDMDMLKSMKPGFEAVKDKIVEGGYLLLHDIQHFAELSKWYDKVIKTDKRFELLEDLPRELLRVLKRVSTSGESRVEETGGEVKNAKNT